MASHGLLPLAPRPFWLLQGRTRGHKRRAARMAGHRPRAKPKQEQAKRAGEQGEGRRWGSLVKFTPLPRQ